MQASGEARVRPEVDPVLESVLSASRALIAIAARSLADAGEEVTLTQYRSLVVLASRGPQSLTALAELLSVKPSTASRMCDRLVRKRLILRRADKGDRRQVRLALSARGDQLVESVTRRRRAEIAELLSAIPRREQAAVAGALQRLADAAGEVREQDWSSGWDL
ncbi:MAG TPA: MarR family transcriptional regulator [Solirubrobacteraceae bacterium]|nr:MarR family transcriptional regulator [Solirubrobacteraceae bacterium]